MNRIIKIILQDILKNKIVLGYTLILAILSWSSFALEDNSAKGLLTILNVILFTVPLVSILFATIYLYNSAEFIELLLSQPVKRQNRKADLSRSHIPTGRAKPQSAPSSRAASGGDRPSGTRNRNGC